MKVVLFLYMMGLALVAATAAPTCPSPPGFPFPTDGQQAGMTWAYYQSPVFAGSNGAYQGQHFVAGWPPTGRSVEQPFPDDWRQPGFVPGPAEQVKDSLNHPLGGPWHTDGVMPFGENVFCTQMTKYLSDKNARVGRPATTLWKRATDLFVIGKFQSTAAGAGFSATLSLVVDNDLLGVWVNGNLVVATQPNVDGCPGVSTPFNTVIHGAQANVVIGENTLAIRVRDHDSSTSTGNQVFLAAQLVTNNVYPTDGQSTGTYGTDGTCVCVPA